MPGHMGFRFRNALLIYSTLLILKLPLSYPSFQYYLILTILTIKYNKRPPIISQNYLKIKSKSKKVFEMVLAWGLELSMAKDSYWKELDKFMNYQAVNLNDTIFQQNLRIINTSKYKGKNLHRQHKPTASSSFSPLTHSSTTTNYQKKEKKSTLVLADF